MDIPERTIEGHKITRVGRGHYLVKSNAHTSISYSVDLSAHGGLGSCECDDFLYRRFPRYKNVKAKFDHFRCKHLRAVRTHVLDQIIAHFGDKEEQ